MKLRLNWFILLCLIIYRTLKPNGTRELFRQHRIGLDKAKAKEELTDNIGDDDTFLYDACEDVEIAASVGMI